MYGTSSFWAFEMKLRYDAELAEVSNDTTKRVLVGDFQSYIRVKVPI